MLDPSFAAIVRRHLPLLPRQQELAPEDSLGELGLDSMASALLVVELERGLGVRLPEHSLTSATFSTAESLWRVVARSMGELQ
jgi:acyl carrier protein